MGGICMVICYSRLYIYDVLDIYGNTRMFVASTQIAVALN